MGTISMEGKNSQSGTDIEAAELANKGSTWANQLPYAPCTMKILKALHLHIALILLSSITTASAKSPHTNQIQAFLEANPKAVPLIVIKDCKGDFSNWERFSAKVIDGDHIHVPNTNPRTKQQFNDFKLIFEFKMDPGANSGIFLRGLGELQMLENTAKKYAKLNPCQYHASAYGLVAAKRGHQKPVGEWNYQEVVVRKQTIVVHLNGTKILDADLSKVTENMKGKKVSPKTNLTGTLGLGGHASGVYYRNMYVAELE